jgi:hypothetical protein
MLGPLDWHYKHHRLRNGSLPKLRECRRCITARAKCAGKIQFRCREDADREALKINVERNWWPDACLKAYRCRYCRLWHMATAVRDEDLRRVNKQRRKHLSKSRKNLVWDYENDRDPDDWGLDEDWLPEAG